MKTILHKAESRGHASYGWLDTHYTFSFAEYYDPARVHFGMLRVLNDDRIDGGEGFGRHPHDNMEIVTIILGGELEHKDSMGNTFIMRPNDVQVMSAGTGIFHSEYNHLPDQPLTLLQIWVYPDKKNITPRYDQKNFLPGDRKNKLQWLVSSDNEGALKINQDAYFSRISLDEGKTFEYTLKKKESGVYLFLLEGSLKMNSIQMEKRDGLGIWDAETLPVTTLKESELLIIEVPHPEK